MGILKPLVDWRILKPKHRCEARQDRQLAGVLVIVDRGEIRQQVEQCLSVHHREAL
jgi:hypothetical protein